MTAELVDKALEIIKDPPTLINMVSRRVNQLNQGRQPLVDMPTFTGAADIALMEIIEEKIGITDGIEVPNPEPVDKFED